MLLINLNILVLPEAYEYQAVPRGPVCPLSATANRRRVCTIYAALQTPHKQTRYQIQKTIKNTKQQTHIHSVVIGGTQKKRDNIIVVCGTFIFFFIWLCVCVSWEFLHCETNIGFLIFFSYLYVRRSTSQYDWLSLTTRMEWGGLKSQRQFTDKLAMPTSGYFVQTGCHCVSVLLVLVVCYIIAHFKLVLSYCHLVTYLVIKVVQSVLYII